MTTPQGPRLAVVTGTSTGIGDALARALQEVGWDVLGVARRERRAEGRYRHARVDLADAAAVDAFIADHLRPAVVREDWARVALVNNAALIGGLTDLARLDGALLARMLAVNVAAPVRLMGEMLSLVPPATPLRIVNLSSGAAHMAIPGLVDYCATKAALRAAGRSAAAELAGGGRDVGIFSYEPGMVETPMQVAARESDPAAFPSHAVFMQAHADGTLHAPADVVVPVVEFMDGDPAEVFTESRYGTG